MLAEGELASRYCYTSLPAKSTTISPRAHIIMVCIYPTGWYEDSVFHVNGFGFPPTEPSSATR